MIDQCPSTRGKKNPETDRATTVNGNGRTLWRSIEEFADSGEFRGFLEREFPAGASELLQSNRRTFLQMIAGTAALAGAATLPGCRRPDHKIYTYSREVPEEVIPGKPLYYATSMPLPGGYCEGVLVETHEGRPTHVEGNPLHPVNQGKSSPWSISSTMGLYDPDRLKYPLFRDGDRERVVTWDDFRAWSADHFKKHDDDRGRGLAFIVDKKTSPARNHVRDRVLSRFPAAQWVAIDLTDRSSDLTATRLAFGTAKRPIYSFEKAQVIVGFQDDSLCDAGGGRLPNERGVAASRAVHHGDDSMSRIYAIESVNTPLGGLADHRMRLSPAMVRAALVELAKLVLEGASIPQGQAGRLTEALSSLSSGVSSGAESIDRAWLRAAAEDLLAAGSAGVVTAGRTLPAELRALAHAINAAINAVGTTVGYIDADIRDARGEESSDGWNELSELLGEMRSGTIRTAVVLDTNPVYAAPAEMGFEQAFGLVPNRIVLSTQPTETARAATWQLDGAHFLESWGDAEAIDGTISPIQPVIAPLYEGALSELELLGLLAERREASDYTVQPSGYELVRAAWRDLLGEQDFETTWRRALHDGLVKGSGSKPGGSGLSLSRVFGNVERAVGDLNLQGAPAGDSLDVIVLNDLMADGRFANVPWLQELPNFGTMVVWDNPLLVSPKTAESLGLTPDPYTVKEPKGRLARLTVDGKSVEMAVWILPGMADNTVAIHNGYGRRAVGIIGAGVGFDIAPVRRADGRSTMSGARLEAIGGKYPIISTQNHWSLESRTSIVRAVDLPAYRKHHDHKRQKKDAYGNKEYVNLAEELGELSHTPPNLSIYEHPYNESLRDPAEGSIYSRRPQWGMTIDLSTCTGCGTCTVACQSENNIPAVGKTEVRKGREMTWIRVDRYFEGEDLNDPQQIYHQPVACVHCENAPCETVCPVNATVHGPEGINYMVYNRCIGTRYCANNCPYKVRRFNFFDYGTKKVNGGLRDEFPEGTPTPENINLIPPRLREQLDEIEKFKMNPDVTIRSRGVMEKCTYCIQRINAARYETKLQDLENIPDGFFQAACQQACPSNSIVFGDLLDESSHVHETFNSSRSYALLGYLATRPRTTYLVDVKNPNPQIREPVEDPFHGGHGDDHGDSHDKNHDAESHGTEGHAVLPGRRTENGVTTVSLPVMNLSNLPGVTA